MRASCSRTSTWASERARSPSLRVARADREPEQLRPGEVHRQESVREDAHVSGRHPRPVCPVVLDLTSLPHSYVRLGMHLLFVDGASLVSNSSVEKLLVDQSVKQGKVYDATGPQVRTISPRPCLFRNR